MKTIKGRFKIHRGARRWIEGGIRKWIQRGIPQREKREAIGLRST